ncbi:hypothetical protein RRF57_002900 [Xylaria bambusicola]|uniref:Uncharacterized protein n=1 Tax=Xylaria bambusicola TaxID=326684 RepID=A0AAN7Z767_9PEZI
MVSRGASALPTSTVNSERFGICALKMFREKRRQGIRDIEGKKALMGRGGGDNDDEGFRKSSMPPGGILT